MFHYWTAVPFFLSIPIALGAVGIAWLRFPEMRIVGGSSILLSIVSLLIMFQPWLTLSIAVFETLEALVAMGWLWFVNYMHYTGRLSQAFNLQEAK
jgi:hypothetical membrane protein